MMFDRDDSDLMSSMLARGERELLRFTPLPEDNVTKTDDIAQEFVVISSPVAFAGLVVFGRNSTGRWIANWSARHVVRHLLAQIAEIRKTLADGLDREPDDITTPHLAVVAINGIKQRDSQIALLKECLS